MPTDGSGAPDGRAARACPAHGAGESCSAAGGSADAPTGAAMAVGEAAAAADGGPELPPAANGRRVAVCPSIWKVSPACALSPPSPAARKSARVAD